MPAPDYDRIMAMADDPTAVHAPTPAAAPPPAPAAEAPNRLVAKLDTVTARALDKLDELLALPINTDDGNLTRAQTAAANTVLNTQAKVDEMRLRAHGAPDIMPKIIQMLKQEKEKLALEKGGSAETDIA